MRGTIVLIGVVAIVLFGLLALARWDREQTLSSEDVRARTQGGTALGNAMLALQADLRPRSPARARAAPGRGCRADHRRSAARSGRRRAVDEPTTARSVAHRVRRSSDRGRPHAPDVRRYRDLEAPCVRRDGARGASCPSASTRPVRQRISSKDSSRSIRRPLGADGSATTRYHRTFSRIARS